MQGFLLPARRRPGLRSRHIYCAASATTCARNNQIAFLYFFNVNVAHKKRMHDRRKTYVF